jgi:hypothetical protein
VALRNDRIFFDIFFCSKEAQAEKGEKEKPKDGELPTEYLNSTLSKEPQVPT